MSFYAAASTYIFVAIALAGCGANSASPASPAGSAAPPTAPHDTRPPAATTPPSTGPVTFTGLASETTEPFRLPTGDALVDWTASMQCDFAANLENPAATGDPPPPVFEGDSGFGEIDNNAIGMVGSGEVNLVGIAGGTYQLEVTATPTSSTSAPGTHCPWTVKFTPGQ